MSKFIFLSIVALIMFSVSASSFTQEAFSDSVTSDEQSAPVENIGDDSSRQLRFKDESLSASNDSIVTYIVMLFVLAGFITAVVFVRQRLLFIGNKQSGSSISVLERKRIGVSTWISLVKSKETQFFIVETSHGVAIEKLNIKDGGHE